MEETQEQAQRMADLSKRLGHLCMGRKIVMLANVITDEKNIGIRENSTGKTFWQLSNKFPSFLGDYEKSMKKQERGLQTS